MPCRPTAVQLALAFLIVRRANTLLRTGSYEKIESYVGGDFFSKWNFFSNPDPTHGFTDYVDREDAFSSGLVNATADRVYMGVDAHSLVRMGGKRQGRRSVRIESKAVYNSGLFIIALDHLPTGCGTWPAFWMFGEDRHHPWPAWGEFDIIEGVHEADRVMTTLHSAAGCDQSRVAAGQLFSGAWVAGIQGGPADNCSIDAYDQNENQGCSQSGHLGSMGHAFNSKGGGTFAAEWDPQAGYIRTWFWPRGQEPRDVVHRKDLEPKSWGMPYSYFTLSPAACSPGHFADMRLIFDITFCGDWAGNVFKQACPQQAQAYTCNEWVAERPKTFQETFWSIRSLDVYTKPGLPQPHLVAATNFANTTDLTAATAPTSLGSTATSTTSTTSTSQTGTTSSTTSSTTNSHTSSTTGSTTGRATGSTTSSTTTTSVLASSLAGGRSRTIDTTSMMHSGALQRRSSTLVQAASEAAAPKGKPCAVGSPCNFNVEPYDAMDNSTPTLPPAFLTVLHREESLHREQSTKQDSGQLTLKLGTLAGACALSLVAVLMWFQSRQRVNQAMPPSATMGFMKEVASAATMLPMSRSRSSSESREARLSPGLLAARPRPQAHRAASSPGPVALYDLVLPSEQLCDPGTDPGTYYAQQGQHGWDLRDAWGFPTTMGTTNHNGTITNSLASNDHSRGPSHKSKDVRQVGSGCKALVEEEEDGDDDPRLISRGSTAQAIERLGDLVANLDSRHTVPSVSEKADSVAPQVTVPSSPTKRNMAYL